ncbi:MAG: hypothetical protein IJT18_04630 [Oscillospiraceae bacterium]|nr:hypothetical protein [Oscillospiraceae bacterium]
MDLQQTDAALSPEEKKRQLYLRQKALLEQFLKTGAISRAQYEKSLGDLTAKMGCAE